MEQIKPTVFKNINTNEIPNAEQLLCGKALDAVIALGIFDQYHFDDLDLCPTNHLLKWCVEVLTAHELNFFERSDNEKRNRLIDDLKMNFGVDLLLACNRTYEMEFNLKVKYEGFFRQSLSLFDFDDAMDLLLDEKNDMFKKMDVIRQTWSLEKFIQQNQSNPVTVESENSKNSTGELKSSPSAVQITALESELISKDVFESTGIPGKRPFTSPKKKESATEKAKKHRAMSHNARRRAGGGNLTKGYLKMPKDRAVFQQWTGTYAPTIKLKDSDELNAFDFEFPPETREHGFMIAFEGQTQYWNASTKKFQTEIIKIKI